MATNESVMIDFTTQASALFEASSTIQDTVAADIAAAVLVSENAAQIPLAQVAINLIDTQTMLVNLIASN
jgi:hypothetical protein